MAGELGLFSPVYPYPGRYNMRYQATFDGQFAFRLTTSPYLNERMADANFTQSDLFGWAQSGYPLIPFGGASLGFSPISPGSAIW